MPYEPELKRLFDHVGGPTKVASMIGVTPSAVTQWRRVPAKWLPRLEQLSDIPARELRPDLFPSGPRGCEAA